MTHQVFKDELGYMHGCSGIEHNAVAYALREAMEVHDITRMLMRKTY